MNNIEENISNFDNSYDFFTQSYTQEELYNFLKNGSLAEKQLACIQINEIKNQDQAETLMQNLTGIDGKIREAVSFKLKNFLAINSNLFKKEEFYDIFLDSIIDINGNICRNTICAIQALTNDTHFCEYFQEHIFTNANKVLNTLDNFTHKDRKYITNKETFKLYWYLETLNIFNQIDNSKIYELLKKTSKIEEYTIREKTANLFRFLTQNQIDELKNINYDNNFYVNLALRK